jgi:hypothetical protein
MMHRPVLESLPFPLHTLHAASDLCSDRDRPEHRQTLLEQTHALAAILAVASRAPDDVAAHDIPSALMVLKGYCETSLALFECWQETWEAQQAEAEAKRRAWADRPLPQDAAAAWAELRTRLEQYDTPKMALLTSLVRLVRTCVPESAIPLDAPPDSPVEEGA